MASSTGGEPDRLAPVIPLFGAQPAGDDRPSEGPPDATAEDRAGSRWHTTWTADGARRTPAERLVPEPSGEAPEGSATEPAVADPSELRDRAERTLVRKLRTRSLSEREARAVLVENGLDDAAVHDVIDAFTQNGYLDDARLAEQLLDSALGRKAQGSTAIVQTLSRRGLPRDVIDAAMATLPDDEQDRALEFARDRVRRMSGLDRDAAVRRLHGQLARRGFGGSSAFTVAKQALDEAGF